MTEEIYDHPDKRYKITHWHQEYVLIEDKTPDVKDELGGKYHITHNFILRRYEELPPCEANALLEGFLEGIEHCDKRLKHCIHNFKIPYGMVDGIEGEWG